MVSYKLDKYDRIFIAFVCVLVVLFNIGSFVFAAEIENLEFTDVSGIDIKSNTNYFTAVSGGGVMYVPMEVGYIYHINIGSVPNARNIAVSNELPSLNVVYDYLGSAEPNSVYSYIPSQNSYFLCVAPHNSLQISFTREKLDNIDSAVSGLVDNVGINNFWSVFEGGIDFVGVVVLVAFGLFLVVLAIKKVSKGKSEF